MASLWQRFSGWVDRHLSEGPAAQSELPDYMSSDIFTPVPPTDEPEYYSDPTEGPITIVDDYGVNRGTQTYDQWYNDTLRTSDQFAQKFGPQVITDFYNLTLIYLLEEELGIDWDWEDWRNEYEARNG